MASPYLEREAARLNPERYIYIPEDWELEAMPRSKPRVFSDFGWTVIVVVSFAIAVPLSLYLAAI